MKYVTAFVLTLIVNSVHADVLECTTVTEQTLTDSGELEATKYTLYKGKTFHVDRKSGAVLGGNLGNSSYERIDVIDKGGDHSSLKVIWVSHLGEIKSRNAVYLVIKTWKKGLIKPFVVTTSDTVLTGTCT